MLRIFLGTEGNCPKCFSKMKISAMSVLFFLFGSSVTHTGVAEKIPFLHGLFQPSLQNCCLVDSLIFLGRLLFFKVFIMDQCLVHRCSQRRRPPLRLFIIALFYNIFLKDHSLIGPCTLFSSLFK